MDIKTLFEIQKSFNNNFFNLGDLTDSEKEEITKSFCLALHAEVSELVSSLNYKQHKNKDKDVKIEKVLFESVDVVRYVLAILNLWEIPDSDFISAFSDKDNYLNMTLDQSKKKWEGQPVLIVDLDDVLIHFRSGFISWLGEKYNIVVPEDSKEYYTSREVKEAGLNPETVFFNFLKDRKLKTLEPNLEMINVINELKDEGFWIQLLTARPKNESICLYDTFTWIKNSNLNFDEIDFSGEKYRWCAKSKYFDSSSIVCAIDDSPKHASEYAKHNIPVVVPSMHYNQEIANMKNVFMVKSAKEAKDKILSIFIKKDS